jgi:hypothetical protein
MAGIDRQTGRLLPGLDSAYQGVEVTLGTRLASRVMRREFGGGIVELLGRSLTPSLFAAWKQLVATAIDLWEPRFKVRRVTYSGSVDEIRRGTAKVQIEADYRPRAHLGDFTVERVVNFSLTAGQGGITAG